MELFEKALKCWNKKQEGRRKRNWTEKNWMGNLWTVEMGASYKMNKKEEENFEQEN